jgi:hypothetical protein
MTKFENWSQEMEPKLRRNNKFASWENDVTGDLVVIEKRSEQDMYDVLMSGEDSMYVWDSFSSQDEALRETRAWLDDHPYGDEELYSVYDPQSGKVVWYGRNSDNYIEAVEAAEMYMEIGTDEEQSYEHTRVQVFSHSEPVSRMSSYLPDDAEFIDKGKTTL